MRMLNVFAMFTLLAVGSLLLAVGQPAEAQANRFSFNGQGGISFPIDHNLYEEGVGFGGQFTYWATESFGLSLGGDVEILSGKSAGKLTGPADVPDMNLYHYRAGFVFRAIVPDDHNPFGLEFNLEGGASTVDISDLPSSFDMPSFDNTDFTETYFGASGGVQIGYRFTDQVSGFVAGEGFFIPTDPDDFIAFSQFDPSNEDAEAFTDLWTLPIRGGIRVNF